MKARIIGRIESIEEQGVIRSFWSEPDYSSEPNDIVAELETITPSVYLVRIPAKWCDEVTAEKFFHAVYMKLKRIHIILLQEI